VGFGIVKLHISSMRLAEDGDAAGAAAGCHSGNPAGAGLVAVQVPLPSCVPNPTRRLPSPREESTSASTPTQSLVSQVAGLLVTRP